MFFSYRGPRLIFWCHDILLLKLNMLCFPEPTHHAESIVIVHISCWENILWIRKIILQANLEYSLFILLSSKIFCSIQTGSVMPWVGVTKASFVNFSVSKIFDIAKVLSHSLNHIHIWQVSPQLSCGNTCSIWMWYSKANMYIWPYWKITKATERRKSA